MNEIKEVKAYEFNGQLFATKEEAIAYFADAEIAEMEEFFLEGISDLQDDYRPELEILKFFVENYDKLSEYIKLKEKQQ